MWRERRQQANEVSGDCVRYGMRPNQCIVELDQGSDGRVEAQRLDIRSDLVDGSVQEFGNAVILVGRPRRIVARRSRALVE